MEERNRSNLMRLVRWVPFLLLCIGLTGEMCLEDRTIDLVVGANVTAAFEARGEQNTHFDERTVDLITDADIQQVLEDNGFDEKVVGRIESAFYRVTKPDLGAPARTVSGMITVDGSDLIEYTSVPVNAPGLADWTPVPLEASGVAYLNQVLEEYFTAIFLGTTPPTTEVVFQVSGTSEPQGIPTDFDWEVRLKVVLVGKKHIEVPDPL